MFTFARYAIESVFRNRRRSLSAVVGIVVAVALVSGSFIAVDSSAYGRLRAALDEIKVDFSAQLYVGQSEIDPAENSEICAALESVSDVEDADFLMVLSGFSVMNGEGETEQQLQYAQVAFLSEDSDRMMEAWLIEGEMPGPGTVAVSDVVASSLQIDPGDMIICSYSQYNPEYINGTYVENWIYVNISTEVSGIWSQGDLGDAYYWWDPGQGIYFGSTPVQVIFNVADTLDVIGQLEDVGAYPYLETSFHVWIDREDVIDVADIVGTVDRLTFIQNRLNREVSSYDFNFYENPLINALVQVNADISGMKYLFFGLSLPVVGLGAYLSLVGVDLGVSARRREVGILKSRGASNRQVFTSLFIESIALGCLAGLLGLLSGVLISRFLVDSAVVLSTSSTASEASFTDISIGLSSVVASIAIGILLMVVSAYRPLKRASKVDAAEALHYYIRKETQLRYKARWDILALLLVALSVVSVITSRDPLGYGRSFLFSIILGFLWLLGIAMLPVMPFLLSASIIRLLTRGSRRLYSKFTRIVKPWTKDLHYLVEKNIVRNPKRASNMCIIIALALAFGLFISITMQTTMERQISAIRSELGSDVRIDGYSSWNGTYSELNMSMLDTVDSLDGVAGSARCYSFSYDSGSGYYSWGYATVLDPVKYCDAVGLGGSWLGGGDRDKLESLEENGTALMSSSYAEQNYLLVGDVIEVPYSDLAVFSLEITGMVDDLPGLGEGIFFGIGTAGIVPEAALASSFILFVDVEDGFDQTEVAAAVGTVYIAAGAEVGWTSVFDERVADIESDPTYGALSDFLYMEYALSFIIMCVGVGLVIFVTVSERERELACIMARGSSSSQMRKVLMGESLSLMSMGFIVGTSVGIFSAFLFDALLQIAGGGRFESFIIIGGVSIAILVASLASFLLASFLATYRVGKLRLAEVLRIRGG